MTDRYSSSSAPVRRTSQMCSTETRNASPASGMGQAVENRSPTNRSEDSRGLSLRGRGTGYGRMAGGHSRCSTPKDGARRMRQRAAGRAQMRKTRSTELRSPEAAGRNRRPPYIDGVAARGNRKRPSYDTAGRIVPLRVRGQGKVNSIQGMRRQFLFGGVGRPATEPTGESLTSFPGGGRKGRTGRAPRMSA